MKRTIIIIEDHTLLRETWELVINASAVYRVVATYANAEEGIEGVATHRPDIVIMDINLPGMSGLEATKHLRKHIPGIKIIGVSMHNQPAFVKQMIMNGAWGYLTKSSGTDELYTALEEVMKGKKYVCEEIKEIIANQLVAQDEQDSVSPLSSRELEIIKFLKNGYSSKEIASELFISIKTVEVHRYNILRKLKLRNVTSLVQYVNKNPQLFYM